MDINGSYAPAGSTWYASAVGGEKTVTLKSVAGKLHYLRVANTTGSTIYAFVFDSTDATGTLLMPPIPLAAHAHYELQPPFAIPFGTGCTVSTSSTQTSYTAGGNNDIQVHALTK